MITGEKIGPKALLNSYLHSGISGSVNSALARVMTTVAKRARNRLLLDGSGATSKRAENSSRQFGLGDRCDLPSFQNANFRLNGCP